MSDFSIQPIIKDDQLLPLIRAVEKSSEVYVDTEADSLHHYFEKVCLIQFTVLDAASNDLHFLVDPLAPLNLESLFRVLEGKTLVFHGADYDLRMLYTHFDFRPSRVFDTMLAARLLGFTALGLDALVERYTGKQLDHSAQKADWSQRPLPPKLLNYAVDDTRFLPLLAQKLREELQSLERIQWHQQQCEQLITLSTVKKIKDPEEVWRIKGSFHLNRKSLAILREIWKWREDEASHWDRPPYMVCGNEKLLEIVQWASDHPHTSLDQGPLLPKRWPYPRVQAFIAALRRAWDLPLNDWPLPSPRGTRPAYDPQFILRLNRLRAVRNEMAQPLRLDPSILAPNAMLEIIAGKNPKKLEVFKTMDRWLSWQTELLGKPFLKALEDPTDLNQSVP